LTGADLRIGLDESNRTLILCDRGDIATDFGLAAETNPTFNVRNAAGDLYSELDYSGLSSNSNLYLNAGPGGYTILMSAPVQVPGRMYVFPTATMDHDNLFSVADAGGYNQTFSSSNSRQAWGYFAPIIAQSGTAAFDGIRVNATLTSVGSGATGDGNNLLNLSVSAVPKFKVDVAGSVTAGQVSVSLADNAVHDTGITAFYGQLIVKDTTTGVTGIFRLDGGATPVIISAHTNFSTTQGTDVKINVYFSTTYKIENCNTAASVVKCAFVGTI
jgi:hypothetical protein